MHPVKHGVEEEKKPEGNKGTDGIIFTFIMKIQTLLRGKSVTVLVYLTFVNLGKEKLYLQSKSEGGIVGGSLNPCRNDGFAPQRILLCLLRQRKCEAEEQWI